MCEVVRFPGGGSAIVCGGRHQPTVGKCVHCRARGSRLCDHKHSDGRTCDASLCEKCSTRGGRNVDYCRVHAELHRSEVQAVLPL